MSSDDRMPAEWEPHAGCLMAWPTRHELWGASFERAKEEYAATADAIAAFEPVHMVADVGSGTEATAACSSAVEVVEIPIDDSWRLGHGPRRRGDRARRPQRMPSGTWSRSPTERRPDRGSRPAGPSRGARR